MISSAGCGMIGSLPPHPLSSSVVAAARSVNACTFSLFPSQPSTVSLIRRSAEDEGEDQTEPGQRHGEHEAGEGDGLQDATGVGLPGHTVDVGGEDQADTDTRADGGETVAEDRDVAF